jgi:hypothetical protein
VIGEWFVSLLIHSKGLEVILSIIVGLVKVSFLVAFFFIVKLSFSPLGLKIEVR